MSASRAARYPNSLFAALILGDQDTEADSALKQDGEPGSETTTTTTTASQAAKTETREEASDETDDLGLTFIDRDPYLFEALLVFIRTGLFIHLSYTVCRASCGLSLSAMISVLGFVSCDCVPVSFCFSLSLLVRSNYLHAQSFCFSSFFP